MRAENENEKEKRAEDSAGAAGPPVQQFPALPEEIAKHRKDACPKNAA